MPVAGPEAAREMVLTLPHASGRSAPAKMPCSNCMLDASELLKCGVKLRTVNEALEESLPRLKAALRAGRQKGFDV